MVKSDIAEPIEPAEPDMDAIGRIVDTFNDHTSEAWSRYHETSRGQLRMSFWKDHPEWKFLAQHYPPCKVLDYGCGTGHADVWLAYHSYDVMGYDPNETNYQVAKYIGSIQPKSIKDRLAFFNILTYRWNTSITWLCHVLEHIPRPEWANVFENIRDIGGKLLVSVPLGKAYYVPAHVNFWNNSRELTNDLVEYGLKVEWADVFNNEEVIRAEANI